ncbi:histidine kinase [Okibacterium endophyticum]
MSGQRGSGEHGTGEDPRTAEHGRSVRATWLYTLGSIVFFFVIFDAALVLTMTSLVSTSRNPVDVALIVLMLVSASLQVRYCWFLRVGRGGGLPRPVWTIALVGTGTLVWVLGILAGGRGLITALPLWMGISLVACLLQRRQRWTLLVLGAALTIAHPVIAAAMFARPLEIGDGGGPLIVIYTALLPFMVLTSIWWWEIVVTLDRNRRTAGDLAVAQERLRFASDLHDIQGHHLQVIALKSELAERLLPIDPQAAREHVHETRMIARQALEETRSLVAGYRHIALDDELENAREVLSAAGAQCDLVTAALPVDTEVRRALAMVVREATTNILRHSNATRAQIRVTAGIDGSTLTISNNGLSGTAGAPGLTASSGLTGLRDRVVAVGGSLETDADVPGDRFELRIWVPTQAGGRDA